MLHLLYVFLSIGLNNSLRSLLSVSFSTDVVKTVDVNVLVKQSILYLLCGAKPTKAKG